MAIVIFFYYVEYSIVWVYNGEGVRGRGGDLEEWKELWREGGEWVFEGQNSLGREFLS